MLKYTLRVVSFFLARPLQAAYNCIKSNLGKFLKGIAMGWAEKRIEEYNQGQKANWVERRALEHANPVHFVSAVVGAIALIKGLWVHSWLLIVVGVLLNVLGHLYCWFKK